MYVPHYMAMVYQWVHVAPPWGRGFSPAHMAEPTKNVPTYLPGRLSRRLDILRDRSEATHEE